MMNLIRMRLGRVLLLGVLLGAIALPAQAQGGHYRHGHSHWRGGVFLAPPTLFLAPPLYYRGYSGHGYGGYSAYSQGYYPAPTASEGCYAGPYVCPLEGPAQVGMPCSCPTGDGRSWGQAR